MSPEHLPADLWFLPLSQSLEAVSTIYPLFSTAGQILIYLVCSYVYPSAVVRLGNSLRGGLGDLL